MQNNIVKSFSLVMALSAGSAQAALMFDANVTPDVIFGSGNANGNYTVDQNNGIELGLRGKLRHNAAGAPENTFNSNGDGTYSFNAGVAPTQAAPTAEWSFEWSINTDYDGSSGYVLSDLTFLLGLDSDPSLSANYSSFDVINGAPCFDHALGNNATGNGGGLATNCGAATAAADYSANISNFNVAQNSWKPHWFIAPFDPTVDGTYDFFLAAFNVDGSELARTSIQIIVGDGGQTTIPEPAPLILLLSGLIGLAGVRKRKMSA
ncbi:PEP-CTERM sorting domain-containing protein [Lacimicrobium sp. SS2-24]|uniref:PEP-CTERM sorting domain-containing protein n=1 Tax=Lacimicrobium sp. SS2-24 TaxID=2005569 RepID=UPI000B4BADC5|nr:PEP-CTERM sorting domain-containing protein [Lacimicrobium sp. SS2-24]